MCYDWLHVKGLMFGNVECNVKCFTMIYACQVSDLYEFNDALKHKDA